jgi:cysteine desulfurase
VASNIEHHAVLHAAEALKKEGFEAESVKVNREGFVEPETIENALKKPARLVSIMHANNEIGTIQPVKEIGEICRKKKALFHSDAVQTVGKEKIDVEKMNMDLLSASAHKFYGPKGVGFLFKRKEAKIEPIMFGGGHERGLRPSTLNTAGIVGMAEALKIGAMEMDEENAKEKKMRDRLIKGALEIKNSWVNGGFPKAAGCAPLGFDFIEGQSMLVMLSDRGIASSTGSACNSEGLQPSHVLLALGLPRVKCHGSLRFTLGRGNTMEDVDYVLEALPAVVKRLREISPLGGN